MRLRDLFSRRRGATGTEYGLILGLVGVAILTAVAATGAALAGLFGSAADSLKGRGIVLEPAHIAENSPAGTVIGTLSGENLGTGLSFALADAGGDVTVSGDSLLAARSFDYEAQSSVTVQIRASGGNTEPEGFVAPVTVTIDNVPDTAPALSLSTASLDFQWVDGPDGSPTPAQSVTVSNGGDLPGTLAITLDDAGGHFERSGGDCGASLAGHSSCTVALRALATENGDWTGSLGLGDAGTVTLTASATGWASEPTLTPDTVTAEIADGTSPGPVGFVTVTNTGTLGSGAIQSELQQDQPWFAIAGGTCGDSVTALAAGGSESCTVGVQRLSGDNDAVQTAQLRIGFANGGARAATVSGGSAGWASTVALSPQSARSDVAAPTSPGPVATFTAHNGGGVASGAVTVSLAPSDGTFIVTGGSCTQQGASVPAGGDCTVTVARTATANDTERSATLTVAFARGGSGSATVAGASSGWASAMSVTPQGVQTAEIADGVSPGPAATFTVTNSGNTATGAVSVQLQIGSGAFSVGGTCQNAGLSLAPNQSCTVQIARTASDNAASASGSVRVGFAAGGGADLAVQGASSGWASAVGVSPSSLTMNVTGGSSPSTPATATFTNTGTKTSGSVTRSISAGSDAFAMTSGGTCTGSSNLAPGQSCTVRVVRFAFQNDSDKTGALTVGFANGGSGTVALNGSSSGFASAMTVTPASGTSNVTGASSPGPDVAFTLRNTGNTLSGAISTTLSNTADFTLTGNGTCDLANGIAANQTCTVTAARTASDTDSAGKTATLNFSFANGGSGSATISGTAAGWASAMAVSSNSIAAGIANGSSPGPATSVTVTNTGNKASGSMTANLSSGGGYFQVTNGCSASVAPGNSCTVSVRRTAGGNDSGQSGTLLLQFANGGSQTIALSGSAAGFANATMYLAADDQGYIYYSGGPFDGQQVVADAGHPDETGGRVYLAGGNNAFRLVLSNGLNPSGASIRIQRDSGGSSCAGYTSASVSHSPGNAAPGAWPDSFGCWETISTPENGSTTLYFNISN